MQTIGLLLLLPCPKKGSHFQDYNDHRRSLYDRFLVGAFEMGIG